VIADPLCPVCASPEVDYRWRVDMTLLLIIDDYSCLACGIRTQRTEAFEHVKGLNA
jgi:RNA polymerase subunit RPABC4/transcription elongation factor Spt4